MERVDRMTQTTASASVRTRIPGPKWKGFMCQVAWKDPRPFGGHRPDWELDELELASEHSLSNRLPGSANYGLARWIGLGMIKGQSL